MCGTSRERTEMVGRSGEATLRERVRDLGVLFGDGPGAPALTTVDWQTVGIGAGPSDAAYFLGAGLHTEFLYQLTSLFQSSTRRFSARLKSPSRVNMYSSDSGVVMGARPPLTPAGSSPITPAKRSLTCWRAQ